jgi:peptidoglycan/xylan/chitin deacetylase (PgdA/CDA1 family)
MTRLRSLARAAQRLVPRREGGLWVLCYHLVEARSALPIDVTESTFRRQLLEISERFWPLALGDALARLEAGDLDHRTGVVLTFDDAYHNFAERAWPVLEELRLPATLFVPIGFIEGESPPPIARYPGAPLRWDELREMTRSGLLTVGSHSWTHPDLRRLRGRDLERELEGSRGRLEERLSTPVESFCYPRGHWSRRVEREVGRYYLRAVVGGGSRARRSTLRPLRIQRLPIRVDTPEPLAALIGATASLEEWSANKARLLRRS